MRLDDWISVFAPASSHRYRCQLCGRELFGQSRQKHARVVHGALLKDQQLVHTRGKWQTRATLVGTQPRRQKR